MKDKLLICVILFVASAGDSWADYNDYYQQQQLQQQQQLINAEREQARAIEKQNQLIQQQNDYDRHYNYMQDQAESKREMIENMFWSE